VTTSTAARIPALLALDQRVLDALAVDRGRRGDRVAQLVHGAPGWRCTSCNREVLVEDRLRRAWGKGEPIRCLVCLDRAQRDARAVGGWLSFVDMPRTLYPVLSTTPEQRREIREVLRGLERVDQAQQTGGWWRRVR